MILTQFVSQQILVDVTSTQIYKSIHKYIQISQNHVLYEEQAEFWEVVFW